MASTESVIGEDSALVGKIAGQDVTILGRFEGDLDVKGRLRIGPRAAVKAVARAQAVEVNGEFAGDIRATRIVFGENARARGTFRSERMSMHDGAWVEGAFNPQDNPPVATATAAAAAQKVAAPATSATPAVSAAPAVTAPANGPANAAPATQMAAASSPAAPAKPVAPIPPQASAASAANAAATAQAGAEAAKDAKPKPETGTLPV